MENKKKPPTWRDCKKLIRAAAHITITRKDKDLAQCTLCGMSHDLSEIFKDSGTSKSSVLLAFTKYHFYKHKINLTFELDEPAIQGVIQ